MVKNTHLKEHEGVKGPGRAIAVAKGHKESPQNSFAKEDPVANVISLQILHKPLAHPVAHGKERLPQTVVHFHFYLACWSYSSQAAAKEYWLEESQIL